MEVRELPIAILERDLDRSCGPARCAANIGDLIFESCGQNDLCARLFAGYLVADRFTDRFDIIRDRQARQRAFLEDGEAALAFLMTPSAPM